MAITMTAEPVSVPTEAALRALCARERGREIPGSEQGFSPVKTPSSDSEHVTVNHVGANLPFVFL